MALLAERVPLTLLCDLVSHGDPESAAINLAERPPGDPLLLEAAVARAGEAASTRHVG
jgi:hypothetical protein